MEKPKTLGGFLQSFAASSKRDIQLPLVAEDSFSKKGWARKLSSSQLEALKKAKPKLSTESSSLELEIVPVEAPASRQSQAVVDKKRMRAALAPKMKRASIDVLNAQLDFRIGLQKKAAESLRGFHQGANIDDEDEPDYQKFKQHAQEEEDIEEEGMGSETTASDDDEEESSAYSDLEHFKT